MAGWGRAGRTRGDAGSLSITGETLSFCRARVHEGWTDTSHMRHHHRPQCVVLAQGTASFLTLFPMASFSHDITENAKPCPQSPRARTEEGGRLESQGTQGPVESLCCQGHVPSHQKKDCGLSPAQQGTST